MVLERAFEPERHSRDSFNDPSKATPSLGLFRRPKVAGLQPVELATSAHLVTWLRDRFSTLAVVGGIEKFMERDHPRVIRATYRFEVQLVVLFRAEESRFQRTRLKCVRYF